MVEVSRIADSSILNEDYLISFSPEHWLNDNIINHYFQLIEANDPKRIKSISKFSLLSFKKMDYMVFLNWTWVRNLIDKHY